MGIPITVRKIAVEDLALGEGTFTAPTYEGSTKIFTYINASNIPITSSASSQLPNNPTTIENALIEIYNNSGGGSASGGSITLYNMNSNVGANPNSLDIQNALTKDPNGDITGGDNATVRNDAYINGQLTPLLVSPNGNAVIKEVCLFGVNARVNAETIGNEPYYVDLNVYEVSIADINHTLVDTIRLYVIEGQENITTNDFSYGSIIAKATDVNLTLTSGKLYGITFKGMPAYNTEPSRVYSVDRVIVNIKYTGEIF